MHPFDKITAGELEEREIANKDEIQAELEREKHLYRRELIGRLMGQRLSPQQYELIAGVDADQDMRLKRELDTNNEEFLATRHQVRLVEETAEKIRRRKVLENEWTEAESKGKLAEYLDQLNEKWMNGKEWRQKKRDMAKFIQHAY